MRNKEKSYLKSGNLFYCLYFFFDLIFTGHVFTPINVYKPHQPTTPVINSMDPNTKPIVLILSCK